MERVIVGFDQDELGDWRAILACGHRQHVRHNPPLVSRPWVLTAEGRSRFLGVALNCKACDEGEPVSDGMIAPDALEAVYLQFHADLVRFIQPHVADPDAAAAVVQDICLHLHAQANDVHESDHLVTRLYPIVRAALADSPDAGDRHPPPALAEAVRGLLACLPGAYRQALILADYLELGPPEMAERLDISPSEAESRVRRGREMIAEALLDWCHFEAERHGWVLPPGGVQ